MALCKFTLYTSKQPKVACMELRHSLCKLRIIGTSNGFCFPHWEGILTNIHLPTLQTVQYVLVTHYPSPAIGLSLQRAVAAVLVLPFSIQDQIKGLGKLHPSRAKQDRSWALCSRCTQKAQDRYKPCSHPTHNFQHLGTVVCGASGSLHPLPLRHQKLCPS